MSHTAWGRVLPALGPDNEAFWTGGERGELTIRRCADCGALQHPPSPVCRSCRSGSVEPHVVSGRATVATYGVNRQAWIPGLDDAYVVAIVELEEDHEIRLTTALPDCDPDDVSIGMPVHVRFERHDDVWVPLFVRSEERSR